MTIHQGQSILHAGQPLPQAQAAMVLIHGRGATAASILELTGEFTASEFAYLAPQAADNTWYPYRFILPVQANEPHLSSALAVLGDLVEQIQTGGIPREKIMILGFSQGACLAVEFAARQGGRFGGVVALSGGLIGDELQPDQYAKLDGTPIFLGCSDIDAHIPLERVKASTQILQDLGGNVTERIYPNMAHTVNLDEIRFIRHMMAEI